MAISFLDLLAERAGQQEATGLLGAAPMTAGPSLEDQIRSQWGQYGEWNAAGVDRVAELAGLLRANGIEDISQFSYTPQTGEQWLYGKDDEGFNTSYLNPDYTAAQLKFGDRTLGFLGDANNDGTFSKLGSEAQGGNLAAWSARGKGNVGYDVRQAPDGSYYIAPAWSSSSDWDTVRDMGKAAATFAAIGSGLQALGTAAGWNGTSTLGTLPNAPAPVAPLGPTAAPITAAELGTTGLGAGLGTAGIGTLGTLPNTAAPLAPLGPTAAPVSPGMLSPVLPALPSVPGGLLGSGGNPLSDAASWMKDNPLLGRLLFGAAGGLLGGSGGGGGYSYDGPMPTIKRDGWSPTAKPTYQQPQPQGLLNTQQGQADSGLWRFLK